MNRLFTFTSVPFIQNKKSPKNPKKKEGKKAQKLQKSKE